MSKVSEIPTALRAQFRSCKRGILNDDAYGQWTEEDQAAAAVAALAMDHAEESREWGG